MGSATAAQKPGLPAFIGDKLFSLGRLLVAVAIFGGANFMSQLIGVVAVYIFAFVFSFVIFFILKLIMGVRVSEEEESEGLDIAEHGAPAYNIT